MEFNLLTLAGISLALMFFGYFFGLFEGRGQGAKKYKAEEDRNQGASGLVVEPLPPPSPPVVPETNNLLALSLNERNQPQLKLDGQRVDASQLAPEQRKRLIDLMLMMRPWIDTSPGQKQVASAPSTQPGPQPVVAAPIPPVMRQSTPKIVGAGAYQHGRSD